MENPNSVSNVADWVEFYVFAMNDGLSKSELLSYIEDSSGSEPEQAFIDDIWLELERRLILYGANKPYQLDVREVLPLINWKDFPEYLTCIILSIDGKYLFGDREGVKLLKFGIELVVVALGLDVSVECLSVCSQQ